MRTHSATLLLLSGLTLTVGCNHKELENDTAGDTSVVTDSQDTGEVQDSDSTDSGDSEDTTPVGVHGTIEGKVYLQLYTTNDSGDLVLLDWADKFDSYPYGAVFVGAYQLDSDGFQNYYGQDVITEPTVTPAPGGDPYSITIDEDSIPSVYVYASLDQSVDGIIGTREPTAAYAEEVYSLDGGTVTGIDITVMVPYNGGSGGGGGGGTDTGSGGGGGGGGPDTGSGGTDSGGGGGGGIDCSDPITVSGTATVGTSYVEGKVAVMLYDTSNVGPYYSTTLTPTPTSTGAEGNYAIQTCPREGQMKVLGAWDSNLNGLIDPADRWGAYVNADDEDANPITIGDAPLANIDVLIPFGDHHPTVIPFVSLSGTITTNVDWSAWGGLYIAALKYRPEGEFTVDSLSEGYDKMSWTAVELAAGTSFDYHVEVPANTITYLWAYGDVDGDGLLNESGEAIGTASANGRIVTGETAQPGIDVTMMVVAAP
jgi:hypothetical protein